MMQGKGRLKPKQGVRRQGHQRAIKCVVEVEDNKGEQERTWRGGARWRQNIKVRVCVCVLPSGSKAKLGVRRVGVAGWEVIGWVEVGVGGTMVVTDTLSTDRQGMGRHTHIQMLLSTT